MAGGFTLADEYVDGECFELTFISWMGLLHWVQLREDELSSASYVANDGDVVFIHPMKRRA